MEGVFNRFGLKVGESKKKGNVILSTFEFKNEHNPLFNLRSLRDDGGMTSMAEGKFVRLQIDGVLFMSDTRMEKNTNLEFCFEAKGNVLIAGLGIGLVLHNLVEKVKSKEITQIVVVENNADVIKLISPYFEDLPIKYICEDIHKLTPKEVAANYGKFDTIYFDIWETIDEDNLTEIAELHNKWKYYKNKGGWMNSWMAHFLRSERVRNNRNSFWY